jgi:hypothetical protein
MTFLGFRHAKRKAKKMVNICPLRSPSPSSGSITTSVVEIGDPSSASAEACYAPVTLHVDVDITPEPLFLGDPFSSAVLNHASSTNPRQSQDRLPRSGLGRSSLKPLRDEIEWVQPRVSVFFDRISTVGGVLVPYTENDFQNGRVAGSAVVGDVIRVRLCRPPTHIPHLVKILRHQTSAVRAKPHLRQSRFRHRLMPLCCRFNDRPASLPNHILLP